MQSDAWDSCHARKIEQRDGPIRRRNLGESYYIKEDFKGGSQISQIRFTFLYPF